MAGGLVQLVAYGVQDLYLTGDPQITFFKILYRRHTNFAIESVPQNFSAPANFGETVTCTLARAGDLVGRIFLYVQIPAIPAFINPNTGEEDMIKKIAWINNLGYGLISEIIVEIGGRQIDKQYGEWMYIWSQVTNKQDHGLNKMVGNIPSMYEFSNGKDSYKLYIPLEFWFCRNNGLALPLISLASSEVKIIVTFRKLEECYRMGPTHSIEMAEDIIPFKYGDYIEQTVNNQTIYGFVIKYDYIQKKLYYIKIHSPTATKKTFESGKDASNNRTYRIYDSITKSYANPKLNAREIIELSPILNQKPHFVNAFLYVNYVYLDQEERNKFSKTNHEYLIEQIQFNQEVNIRSPNVKQNLALNHPCKAFYWVAQLDMMVGPNTMNDLFNYTTSPIHYPYDHSTANNLPPPVINEYYGVCLSNTSRITGQERFYGTDLVKSAELQLNGHDRFGNRNVDYFNLVEPYEHHYRGPNPGINVYSISLNPEDHQPSSAINMSEIGHIVMQMRLANNVNPLNTAKIRSYTISYNILRIFFNMGGLAFI